MSQTVAEMREHARVTLAPSVVRSRITVGGEDHEGYLMNLSLGGAFLGMGEPPPVGTNVDLAVLLPWGIGECRLTASVAWEQQDESGRGVGSGVSFHDVSPLAQSQLRQYLKRFIELSEEITE